MRKQRAARKKDILNIGDDIISSKRFMKAKAIPHHFDYSVAAHSLDAAECALGICRWLKRRGVSVCEDDVVRTSLLHDIGMTEDDVFQSKPSEKAYTHPTEGARIAREEFGADDIQSDAILYHMWPIGHIAPHHALGWILVAADKWSSIREACSYATRSINQFVLRKRKGAK